MIEFTPEIIDIFSQKVQDHVGYAMSRNTGQILMDLKTQADLLGVSKTSIGFNVVGCVSADDDGLHLTIDRVKWRITRERSDKDFYTVDVDPRQPDLPGFEREATPQKPVVDVKALPEHADDQNDEYDLILHDGLPREDYSYMLDWNLHAAYKLFYSTMEDMKLYMTLGRSVEIMLDPYTWEEKLVPNIKEAMQAIDADQNAVLVEDIGLSAESRDKLVRWGYGVMILKWFPVLQKWQIDEWKGSSEGKWSKKIEFPVEEKDKMMDWIKSVLADDDVVFHQREFFKELK